MKILIILVALIVFIIRCLQVFVLIAKIYDKSIEWDSRHFTAKESSVNWFLKPLKFWRMVFSFKKLRIENFKSKELIQRIND